MPKTGRVKGKEPTSIAPKADAGKEGNSDDGKGGKASARSQAKAEATKPPAAPGSGAAIEGSKADAKQPVSRPASVGVVLKGSAAQPPPAERAISRAIIAKGPPAGTVPVASATAVSVAEGGKGVPAPGSLPSGDGRMTPTAGQAGMAVVCVRTSVTADLQVRVTLVSQRSGSPPPPPPTKGGARKNLPMGKAPPKKASVKVQLQLVDYESDVPIAEQLRQILQMKSSGKVVELFRQWDADGDGVISKREVCCRRAPLAPPHATQLTGGGVRLMHAPLSRAACSSGGGSTCWQSTRHQRTLTSCLITWMPTAEAASTITS